MLFAFIDGQPLNDRDLSATGLIERVAGLAAGSPAGDRHGRPWAGRRDPASTDRLRALHQALIWSQTAIGWLAFLTALLAARSTGRGGAG